MSESQEQEIEPGRAQAGDLIEYRDLAGIARMPFVRWHEAPGGRKILLGRSQKTGLETPIQEHRFLRMVRKVSK